MLLTPFCLIKMKANINLDGVLHQLIRNRLPVDGVLKAVGSISGQERDSKAMCYKIMAGSNFQTSSPQLTNHMYVLSYRDQWYQGLFSFNFVM
jgi:hypothetical protein